MAQFIGQPVQLPAAAFRLPSQFAPLGDQPLNTCDSAMTPDLPESDFFSPLTD